MLKAAAPGFSSTQAETLTCALTAMGKRSPEGGQRGGLDDLQALAVAGDHDAHVEAPRDRVLNVGLPPGEKEAIQELQATVPAFGKGAFREVFGNMLRVTLEAACLRTVQVLSSLICQRRETGVQHFVREYWLQGAFELQATPV